jgi:hypothetical protein
LTDYGLNGEFKKVFDFLSSVNQMAYKNVYLLSNEVLSKNPFTNNFIIRFLKRENPEPPDSLKVFLRLLTYYLKSFIYFGIYLLFFTVFHISRLKYAVNPFLKELIVIDTFFLMDEIEKNGNYKDPYFVGLKEILEKLGKHYAYLPVFYMTKNPARLFKTFRLLKKNKIPVLTEYQLLSAGDLFRLFYFILKYPIDVLIFAQNLKEDTHEAKLLKAELTDNLRLTTFLKFSRYLQGMRIAELGYEKIKLISWYENQTVHKNLYKGLRASGTRAKIYGAQLFLYGRDILNIHADENENVFGVVPDKIIVNGDYFMPKKSRFNYSVGPSLRYKRLFTTMVDEIGKKNILVILPYFTDVARDILKLIRAADISSKDIVIKNHPAAMVEKYKDILFSEWKIIDEDIYKLFSSAALVIGSASGTLIEAISCGIPVIAVKKDESFACDILPDYGKGLIWDEAINVDDLNYQIKSFKELLKNKPQEIKKIANDYKSMFFCEPTEDNIIRAFELNSDG